MGHPPAGATSVTEFRGTIKIGDPIDGRLYLTEYTDRRTRKEGIPRLVHDLQTNIQSMIDALNAEIDGAWGR